MKFCPDCSNFLYIKDTNDAESGESYLEDYCRNCGFSEKRTEYKIDTFKIDNEITYKNINPKEIVNDLTYNRTRVVKCPRENCPSNVPVDPKDNEVLYFKQKGKLRLNYVCCNCMIMWKN